MIRIIVPFVSYRNTQWINLAQNVRGDWPDHGVYGILLIVLINSRIDYYRNNRIVSSGGKGTLRIDFEVGKLNESEHMNTVNKLALSI